MADSISSGEKVAGGRNNSQDAPGVFESPAPHEMSIGEYCATRFTTLKPPMNKVANPFKLLGLLNGKQWLFFLVGFIAWYVLHYLACSITRFANTRIGHGMLLISLLSV